jgi:hypothetical protein
VRAAMAVQTGTAARRWFMGPPCPCACMARSKAPVLCPGLRHRVPGSGRSCALARARPPNDHGLVPAPASARRTAASAHRAGRSKVTPSSRRRGRRGSLRMRSMRNTSSSERTGERWRSNRMQPASG